MTAAPPPPEIAMYEPAPQALQKDLGARINEAIAALPTYSTEVYKDAPQHCGVVSIPAGDHHFSTTIVKPMCVVIEGNGAHLHWDGRGKESAFIVAGPHQGATTFGNAAGGINNLWLDGEADINKGTGADSGYIGILLGGDAKPSTANTYGAFAQTFNTIHVEGFQYGVVMGRYSSLDSFYGGDFNNNGVGLWYPKSAYGSGEVYSLFGVEINNSYQAGILDDACGEIRQFGGSIDYTGGVPGQPFYAGSKPGVTGECVDYESYGTHFEQDNGPIIRASNTAGSGGRVGIHGGELYTSGSKGAGSAYVLVTGLAPIVTLDDVHMFSQHTMSSEVQWEATGCGELTIHARSQPTSHGVVTGNLAGFRSSKPRPDCKSDLMIPVN